MAGDDGMNRFLGGIRSCEPRGGLRWSCKWLIGLMIILCCPSGLRNQGHYVDISGRKGTRFTKLLVLLIVSVVVSVLYIDISHDLEEN